MKKARVFAMILLVVLSAAALAACAKATQSSSEAGEVARPSNQGGPGQAVSLTGDAAKGADIFAANCASCHGDQGKGGVENTGSVDGTVPPLNPIDESLINSDTKAYVTNLDLFVEHGSTPEAKEGSTPDKSMPAFGDQKTLAPQDIANVIAYVISLNKK